MTLTTCFCFTPPSTTPIYTLSLHDALPISEGTPRVSASSATVRPIERVMRSPSVVGSPRPAGPSPATAEASRSEEHTSELQSLRHLVCRLLLEKKKNNQHTS